MEYTPGSINLYLNCETVMGISFQFSTVRFPIKTDNIDDIRTRLDTEPNLDRHDREGHLGLAALCGRRHFPKAALGLLGEIRILATTVELSVNSTVRAQNR